MAADSVAALAISVTSMIKAGGQPVGRAVTAGAVASVMGGGRGVTRLAVCLADMVKQGGNPDGRLVTKGALAGIMGGGRRMAAFTVGKAGVVENGRFPAKGRMTTVAPAGVMGGQRMTGLTIAQAGMIHPGVRPIVGGVAVGALPGVMAPGHIFGVAALAVAALVGVLEKCRLPGGGGVTAATQARVMDNWLFCLVTLLTIIEPCMVKADGLPVGRAVAAAALAGVMGGRGFGLMAATTIGGERLGVVKLHGRPRLNILVAALAANVNVSVMIGVNLSRMTTGAAHLLLMIVGDYFPVDDAVVAAFTL
jgi:hypothetical protein